MRAVYRGYSPEGLDAQYDQKALVQDFDRYLSMWKTEADRVEATTHIDRMPYGEGADEYVEILHSKEPPTGVHIHFHGGGWNSLTSEDAWHVAPPWIDTGWDFVSVNYSLLPTVTLEAQIAQAQAAVQAVVSEVVGSKRLLISGHSAGAYLAASVALLGSPLAVPFRLVLASGVYDLEPVRLTSRNAYLGLNQFTAARLSPIRVPSPDIDAIVLWSATESDELRRQSREFADAVGARAIVTDAPSHFDTWDRINPDLVA
ncbi:MAG: alpha/beta hydrolase [Acidimicrobiia bacterium]